MGNEVICLKDETDAIVSVGVPVAIAILLGGNAIDEQVARIVMVEPTDDIEHGRFARARRSQNGDKFIIAESKRHMVERDLREVGRDV